MRWKLVTGALGVAIMLAVSGFVPMLEPASSTTQTAVVSAQTRRDTAHTS